MISVGVRIYCDLCEYVTPPTKFNGTLVVDSPFQTLVIDFSSNLSGGDWMESEM